MASGMPDYYRGVRPRYGASKTVIGGGAVGANVKTDLVEVTGKGMIYGGNVYLSYTSTQKDGIPILKVDGTEISTINFFTMNFFGLCKGYSYPFSLLVFDDTNFVYSAGVAFGFTFEEGVEVVYDERNGGTPTVVCRLVYALI